MRAAILYFRKSTKDDREAADQSVTRQEELGRAYAAELKVEVAEVYRDNEVQAKDWKNRTDWKRLRADVEAGRWGSSPLLIVMDQARLMREPKRGPAEVGAVEEDAGEERLNSQW